MKKAFAAILLIIFFVVNTGFAVNLHYCMDRINSVELGASASDTCGKCGMETNDSNGCCRDEVKIIKLQQEVLVAKAITPSFSLSPIVQSASFFLDIPQDNFLLITEPISHPPPLIGEQDTYLDNCVFRL